MKKFISLLLVCLMVVPFGMLATTGVSADAAKTVYLSDAGDDANDGSAADKAVKTLTKAYELLGTDGGAIVISGVWTKTNGNVALPAHTGTVTIKGADANAEWKYAGGRMNFNGPTVIENIKINQSAAIAFIANYNDFTIGDGVSTPNGKSSGNNTGKFDTFVVGGHAGFAATDGPAKSFKLTIMSGNWMDVTGVFWKDAVTEGKEVKDIHVEINVGGTAVIDKLFFFARSGKYAKIAEGSSCEVNFTGGQIVYFAAAHDSYAADNRGFGDGVIVNIKKGFDLSKSFDGMASMNEDRCAPASNGMTYYGLSGDSAWYSMTGVTEIPAIGKTKVVIDADLYDSIKDSNKFRDVTIAKASAQAPSQPDQPGDTPSTGDMTWVVAVVAAVAVTGSCVVLKKREN